MERNGQERDPATVCYIAGVSVYSVKCFILPAIWLLIGISMVAVGENYTDCSLGILFYLKITGGVMIGFAVLSAILIYSSSNYGLNEGCSYCMATFMLGTCLGLTIWGSTVVFRSYGTWTYDPKASNSELHCNFMPYTLAFAFLVIQWIIFILLMPIFCICMCNCLCTTFPYLQYFFSKYSVV